VTTGTYISSGSWSDSGVNATFTSSGTFTLSADVTQPTNSITAPTGGQRWSNAVFTVAGTASDNAQVASVWIQMNSTGWQAAFTANHWANWTATASLTPGTNFLQAYAADTSGNVSFINSVSLQFVVTNLLQVRSVGLELSRQITAMPGWKWDAIIP
jgi:hypothetical protein